MTYTYNNVNELLLATGAKATYLYDLDGNMTQGYSPAGQASAVYDAENRLASFQDSLHQTEYTYSGDGILATKMLDKLTSYIVVNYIGHGGLPLQERDADNSVIREYTRGPDMGGGIGGMLGLRQGGKNYLYFYDGKGNVTAVTDSSVTPTVVATYAYDPFGNLMAKTGTMDQPCTFSSKPYDAITGLSYYGHRFYAPAVGRWMTRDPIGESGGVNLYGFVMNNPVNLVDPMGNYGISYAWNWWKDYFKKLANKQKKAWCKGGDPRDALTAIDDIDLLKAPPVRWISPGDVAAMGVQNVDAYFNRQNSMMPQNYNGE